VAHELDIARADLDTAIELVNEDESFLDEADELSERVDELEEKLRACSPPGPETTARTSSSGEGRRGWRGVGPVRR
jgi:hypothetical protein